MDFKNAVNELNEPQNKPISGRVIEFNFDVKKISDKPTTIFIEITNDTYAKKDSKAQFIGNLKGKIIKTNYLMRSISELKTLIKRHTNKNIKISNEAFFKQSADHFVMTKGMKEKIHKIDYPGTGGKWDGHAILKLIKFSPKEDTYEFIKRGDSRIAMSLVNPKEEEKPVKKK